MPEPLYAERSRKEFATSPHSLRPIRIGYFTVLAILTSLAILALSLIRPSCHVQHLRSFQTPFTMPKRITAISQQAASSASDPPTSVASPSTTPDGSMNANSVKNETLPRTFTDNLPLPGVLVFDLDYTLWPFWCDTHCTPPFKAISGSDAGKAVTDRYNERFGFYSEVPGILVAAREKGVKVAAASRTHAPDVADQLLRMLTVGDGRPAKGCFDNLQIYPGDKVRHMMAIHKKLGCEYEDMLFFDDEERNRNVERERGVMFCLVRAGVTRNEIDKGIDKWRKARGRTSKE